MGWGRIRGDPTAMKVVPITRSGTLTAILKIGVNVAWIGIPAARRLQSMYRECRELAATGQLGVILIWCVPAGKTIPLFQTFKERP